jgi:tight adherence protein C
MLGQIPYVLFAGMFAMAVFALVWALFPADTGELEKRMGMARGVEGPDQAVLVDAFRPFYRLFVPFVRGMDLAGYRAAVERRFISAGMTGRMTTDEFLAYKVAMGVFFWGLFIAIFAYALLGTGAPITVHVLVLALGSFFPDIWLVGQVQDRQTAIRRALPYVMDLLTLSVEAGLDFVAGVHRVCEKAPKSALIDELAFMLREVQLGSTRQQALRALATRVDMPEIRSFAALLVQADILGASIGPVLRAQADLLRTQRFQAAERAGAYAAVKLLFPLILFIMPAVFIVIFGPIALNFLFGDMVIGG